MSYFSKYILLLIYTFIHKINNHKKIIRLNKILRGRKKKKKEKKVTTLLCTIALEFQVVSYMQSVHRGEGRGHRQWWSFEGGDVIRQTVCGKGKQQQKNPTHKKILVPECWTSMFCTVGESPGVLQVCVLCLPHCWWACQRVQSYSRACSGRLGPGRDRKWCHKGLMEWDPTGMRRGRLSCHQLGTGTTRRGEDFICFWRFWEADLERLRALVLSKGQQQVEVLGRSSDTIPQNHGWHSAACSARVCGRPAFRSFGGVEWMERNKWREIVNGEWREINKY